MKAEIEMQIADRVYEAEKRNAAALGHDRMDVAMLSFGAFCGVLLLVHAEDKPLVKTSFRPVRK